MANWTALYWQSVHDYHDLHSDLSISDIRHDDHFRELYHDLRELSEDVRDSIRDYEGDWADMQDKIDRLYDLWQELGEPGDFEEFLGYSPTEE